MRPGILLGVILLTGLVAIALVVSLFWINRRMKMLGMGPPRSQHEDREPLDPWAEAGRRMKEDDLPHWPEDDRPGNS